MTTFQEAFASAEESTAIDAEVATDEHGEDTIPTDDGGQEAPLADSNTSSSEPSYFDLDAHGDQLVQIKVNGELTEVPLSELPNGYMRNEAFTQKSQALAEERRQHEAEIALAQAYVNDPTGTIRVLAEQNNLTLAEATAIAEAAEEAASSEPQLISDPRIEALERRFEEQDRKEAKAALFDELGTLAERYGEDFDAEVVARTALDLGTTDLEAAYKVLAYDRLRAREQAAEDRQRERAEEDAKVTAAKQALGGVVSSGGSAAGAGVAGSAPDTSIAGAFRSALADLGDPWE